MPRTALKESEIKNLQTVSQDEYNRIVDALYQNPNPDYKNIPHIIKLPEMNKNLAARLGVLNSNFFLRTSIAHVRPQRKGGYGQSLRIDEMKGLLDFLKNCETAYIDTNIKHQNFFLAGLDETDQTKANKVVFNKDKLGNYIVTIGKIDASDLNERDYTKVAVGLGPTIWRAYKKRPPATMLRPSTTSANQNISQTQNLSNSAAKKKTSEFRNYVQDWIVELASEAGLNIKGYKHKVTEEFKNHTLKEHGNSKIESQRGQIAVTEKELDKIDDILQNPDFAVAGVKRQNKYGNFEDRIILVKNTENGAILFEEVLSGRRNKTLNAKTLIIRNKPISKEKLVNILASNSKNNIDNLKIKYADAAAAVSAVHSAAVADGRSQTDPRFNVNSNISQTQNLSNSIGSNPVVSESSQTYTKIADYAAHRLDSESSKSYSHISATGYLNIGQLSGGVKPNLSKVIDENGEPLATENLIYQKSSSNKKKNQNQKEKTMAEQTKPASRIDPKTYRFQNGMSIDDIALLGNYTRSEAVAKITQGNASMENLSFYTDAEKKIIEGVKNSTLAPDAKACMVDNVERYIAASHWNPQTRIFSNEPERMVVNWPYEIPNELDRHFMEVYNSKRFTSAVDFSLGLHEDVPRLDIDDYTVSKRQVKESEETRDKIISEVLSGEKSGMYTSFKKFSEHGVFDIRNAQVELSNGTITETGWKQLQAAMEIYRNKRFETTRYVFIDKKTGRVKDQLALSSHLPNVSVVSEDNGKTLMQVITRARETNCVVAMAHNHPSGNVEQSVDDMKTTAEIEKFFKTNGGEQLFAGHIILDHENFNLYTPGKGWNKETPLKERKDALEKENKAGWENKYIGSTEALKNVALSDVARAINESQNYSDDFIPVAFADTQLKMSGVQFFHKSFFEKEPGFIKDELELAGRQAGATRAFPVFTEHYLKKLDPIQKIELDKKLRSCISHNAFCDACVGKEVISEKYGIEPGNAYFSAVEAEKVVPEVHATFNTEKHKADESLFRKMTEADLPQRKVAEKEAEFNQVEDDDYIHSEEFISKFGDWEKANRLEKLKKAKPLEKDDKIFSSGKDITETVENLVKNRDRKSIQAIEKELGKNIAGIYVNKDTGLRINVSNRNVIEISNHNYLQKEHIQAIQYIPEIIDRAIYISDVENEDKAKHPNIQKYKYLAAGLTINGIDFTCKTVVGVDKSGNCYYDQSLSTIEKGKLIDIIQEKNKLGNLSPLITQRESELSEKQSPYVYYDKRLINICQVPQMPYLEMVDGKWRPKPETIQDVKNGKLFLEKKGQISVIHDSSKDEILEKHNKSVVSENNQTYQKSSKKTKGDKNMENTIKTSELFEELEPYLGGSKENYRDLLDYAYWRSADQEAERYSIDNSQLSFNDSVANSIANAIAKNIVDESVRDSFIKKMESFAEKNLVFDPDNIDTSRYVVDKEDAKDLNNHLSYLKEKRDSIREQKKLEDLVEKSQKLVSNDIDIKNGDQSWVDTETLYYNAENKKFIYSCDDGYSHETEIKEISAAELLKNSYGADDKHYMPGKFYDLLNKDESVRKFIKSKAENEIPKVDVKSYVSDQKFTGRNSSKAERFRQGLIENGTVRPDEDFLLISEKQAQAAGCKINTEAESVMLLCPPSKMKPDFHYENYFHVSAVDDIKKLENFYNKSKNKEIIYSKTKNKSVEPEQTEQKKSPEEAFVTNLAQKPASPENVNNLSKDAVNVNVSNNENLENTVIGEESTEIDPDATVSDEIAQETAPEENFTFLDDETARKLEPETIDAADIAEQGEPVFEETSVELSEVAEAQEKLDKIESENKAINAAASRKAHNSETQKYAEARNKRQTKEDIENAKYLENLKKEIEQLKKENKSLSLKVEELEKQNKKLMNEAKVTDERSEKEKSDAEKSQKEKDEKKSAGLAANSVAELSNRLRTLQKENDELKKGNSSLKKENEQIKKANKWYKDAMYKNAKVEVNGVVRECKEGLVKGFKNAVSTLDKVRKDNIHLAVENKTLKAMSAENYQAETIVER